MRSPAPRLPCQILPQLVADPAIVQRPVVALLYRQQKVGHRLTTHHAHNKKNPDQRSQHQSHVRQATQPFPSLQVRVIENLLHRGKNGLLLLYRLREVPFAFLLTPAFLKPVPYIQHSFMPSQTHFRLPRRWPIVILALAAGVALRLWFIHAYPEILGDPLVYGSIAKNWMLHGVYGTTLSGALRPTLIRLPGYPLFLMLCFKLFGMEHYHAVMYAQTGIDLGTCLLIAAFTRRIWNAKAGWWALWLAALCPFTANYAAVPLTETLELFSIALALYALARFLENPGWGWAALEAAAWSYAALL